MKKKKKKLLKKVLDPRPVHLIGSFGCPPNDKKKGL